jgi:hypothetical protein
MRAWQQSISRSRGKDPSDFRAADMVVDCPFSKARWLPARYNRKPDGGMDAWSLDHVSVAASNGESCQVSFAQDGEGDDACFRIQWQFGLPDRGHSYVEGHRRTLCGHFQIR